MTDALAVLLGSQYVNDFDSTTVRIACTCRATSSSARSRPT